MTDPQPTAPPAGWYTDPSGQPGQRWWDGANWTQSTQPTPAPAFEFPVTSPAQAAPQQPYGIQQRSVEQNPYGADPYVAQSPFATQNVGVSPNPYAAQGPYVSQGPYGTQQPYGAQSYGAQQWPPANINPSTRFIWMFVFAPFLAIPINALAIAVGGLDHAAPQYAMGDLVIRGGQFLGYLLLVLLAFLDNRELKARQLPDPFPWGWGFIPLVYLIGRSAVVRSRTGRGLAPLIVSLSFVAVAIVLAIAAVVLVVVMAGSIGPL